MSMLTKLKYLCVCIPCFAVGLAQANSVIDEYEPNNTVDNTQMLMAQGQVSVPAFLGNGGPYDLDYYTFYAIAGSVVTVDIDNGYVWGGTNNVDTMLAIFDNTSTHNILRFDDDAPTLDPGSTSRLDARIDNFVVPTTGYYEVGVSNWPRYFQTGGGVINYYVAGHGDYTLVITGVTTAIKQIAIEVKPGSNNIAPINPKSRGKIPVAILGGPDFDAMTVNTKRLTFGSTGYEHSLNNCSREGVDLNGDGRLDLLCHFDTQAANFKKTDAEAKVHGWTTDGTEFEGTGFLKVIPEKGRVN